MNITESEYNILHTFLTRIAPVDNKLFDKIKPCMKKKTFKKGDVILREGKTETQSNIVLKGVVHQFVYDNETPVTSNLTPRGLVFNSIKSYIEESPSSEIQEAITDVELLCIKKHDIETLARANHQFSYAMYKIHEDILLHRERRMFLLQHRSPSKRYVLFHEIIKRSNWLLEGAPAKYIASYLNMTPQQYSKEKNAFEKAKK
ncbi:Crp/Fnr family transcriptional regulator [Flammeovirgaceae bacterium SG7u.132]|nr:Crp/Fnr family transcriptional regulator [Flammeovirgaceae bacterium SG7u.132]